MIIPEYVLIIANSGRMLAQAAKNVGLKPLVIDIFADIDTRQYAYAFQQVTSLSEQDLIPVIDHFIGIYGVESVIYGSGFEYYPHSLNYLSKRLLVLGNSSDTFCNLQNKPYFFSSLDKLSLPYPDVRFMPPNDLRKWLVKPMQGQGGLGIKRYILKESTESADYWQRFQEGTQHSVLFLATEKEVQVIGFNTQWSISLSPSQEFMFSGVMNSSELPNNQKLRIAGWLKKLVSLFSLRGLNSLDFIQDGDKSFILEVNPRPSASMQLYNDSLLMSHIKACQGELIDCYPLKGYSGYQIVYATEDVTIPDGFEWPEGYVDLPECGVTCRTGQPICSIITHQKQASSVMNELQIKQLNLLKGFNTHGI